MMKPLIECLHDEEVGRLLTGEVDAGRTSELEQHLASCIDCRQRLEQQVGDDGWWNETESSLRSQHVAASLRNAEDGPAYAASLGETRLRESILDLLGPTDDPNMLGRIGPYEIIGLLGQGGMGAVFKGFDRSLNRFVAIKMLLPHLAASGAARKRFAREGQAVAAVVDDHVMAIHCVDEWQGVPYLVMTYSRGVSLQKRLSDNGPLEVREILRIGMQAAKGLAAAHAQGIVHRDIKPANIFLDQNVERVQLMDFGLARAVDDASLTRSGTLAGTPQYMSPEQARAETVDHRSDLFSLGSVMYAMCTGHPPFRAESSYSVLRLITDKEPRPIREINPEIPEWLCLIISKLMSKSLDDRFANAKEVADLLEQCLAHVQQPTSATLPASLLPQTTTGRSVFNVTRTGVMTMLGTIGMTLLGMVLWQATDPPNSNVATAVESDVSVALKFAVERDSSIPDKEWRSLDARNQAIDSQNVTGTPLTLMFLAMPKPATVSKLMTDELEVFESATAAEMLDEIERNNGPFTFIHKDRISEIEYKIEKDVAVGTFTFFAPGLYKGKIGFRARKMETDWSITEFKLNAYGVQLVRDGESWKTKTVAVSESKRDIEKLRGEWRVTNIRPRSQRPRSQEVEVTKFEESSFVFTESHLTVTGTVTGTEKRVAEITLRDDSSPKEIDLKATEGVGAGKTAYGIYRFDGDRLVLCIGEVRPVKFTDEAGLLVLERRQINNQSLKTPAIDHRNARSLTSSEVVMQNANVSAPPAGDAAKAAPAESPLLVEARKALQACQNSLSWKQKFDMRVTNSYVHSQVGKVTIESRLRRDAPRMVESSLQTFDDQPKDHIRLDNWCLDDGEMFISRTTTVGQKKLTGLMTIKGRQKASWRMFESSSSFAMEGHFPGNQGRTLMELLMESKQPDVRMEKIGHHDCLRISHRNDWGTMTVWIDAGPSRRLRQWESSKERGNRFADGRVGEDKDTANLESFSYFVEEIQYKLIDGIDIAVSCRVRSTSIPNGGIKQEISTVYKRTEIHLRPDFAINNPFVHDFDNGARINDGDAFDRDAAFRWQDGKLTPLPNTKPSIVDENKRPSDATVPLKSTNTNSVVGHWKIAKLADMPVAELAGATVVIDKDTVKMHVPSQKGPHPHWRYTLVAGGEIDLCEIDDAKGETTSRAKYSLEGKTLYLALNAKKGDYPRPESATGEVPQAGVQYIVLEMDELASSTGTAVPHNSGDERHDDKPQVPALQLGKTLQQLQGKWRLSRQIDPSGDESATPDQSVWEFKGDRIIVRDGGPGGAMLIEVDDTQSPVHVKLTNEVDEVSGLGLMSVEGDKAIFFMTGKLEKAPEPQSRPEKLQWVSGVYYMELTRMKPGESIVPLHRRSSLYRWHP